MDAFDLIRDSGRIHPAFAFDALFLAIGPGLLWIALVILRHVKRGIDDLDDRVRNLAWFLVPFSAIWIAFTVLMCGEDIVHGYAVRDDAKQGRYAVLQGCLDGFHPGIANPGRSTAGNERWAVEGHEFSYGDNEIRFQSIGPLASIYGDGIAAALVENTGTKLILRCSASEGGGTARFASDVIGQRDVWRQSTNSGTQTHIQGVNQSQGSSLALATESAVLPSEIEKLPDLNGYLRSPSVEYWARVAFMHDGLKQHAAPYVPYPVRPAA